MKIGLITAYGFLTRGCPRHCQFCIVGDKEGLESHKVADLSEFWRGQKHIELLDPNLLASRERIELLGQLADSKAKVNFSQGLDVRFVDRQVAEMLNEINKDLIHFAWDNYEFKTYEKLKEVREWITIRERETKVYVLTNFNTTHEQDLERIEKLRELGYNPYVMIYDKPNAPKITRHLQRWCNNEIIYRSCEWKDYDRKEG